MRPPIRSAVYQLTPYSPGKPISEVQREFGLERVVKLASNENPLGPSPKAVLALKSAAENAHIYPDGAAYDFRSAVNEKFGIPYDQVLVGNGSDELIHLLGLIFLEGPDDEVVVGNPSFVRYDAAAHLAGSRLVPVPLDENARHDLPAMLGAVTSRTKLVFIANPNNPTGTLVYREEFDAFLSALPPHVTVVLDEAYFEFAADEPNFPNSADYIRSGATNVVGLRTLSKTYGLAGIRLGYGFAPPAIADAIQRVREPFNANALAQVAGVAALQDDDHIRRTVENNRSGLERLRAIFESYGAKTFPSFANFIFADLGRPSRPIFERLLELGVIVRPGDVLGAPNCLRVSVGTTEEID
ncbi:MAG TPA: histidinol-phosphate transaminase, partial [Fimbriimonadaceae bacterium]|nr:histidinol-phosphate transaminase [Fimbriimonadaceae bacterium]